MAKPKTTGETRDIVPKVPQPHGGALNARGTKGNKGGGRPRSVIREAARKSFDKRIPALEKIADKGGKDSDKVAAMRLLMQAGGVDQEPPVDRELIRELADAIDAEIRMLEGGADALGRIYERWSMVLGRYTAT